MCISLLTGAHLSWSLDSGSAANIAGEAEILSPGTGVANNGEGLEAIEEEEFSIARVINQHVSLGECGGWVECGGWMSVVDGLSVVDGGGWVTVY